MWSFGTKRGLQNMISADKSDIAPAKMLKADMIMKNVSEMI
jgi:hypothetical protein